MLGIGPQKPRETLCWGSVTAASGDALTVNVKGQSATAVKCCNASVGDVVALECLGGTYRAIGRRGGEGEIPDIRVKSGTVSNYGNWTGTYILRKSGNVVTLVLAAVHATTATTMGTTSFTQNQVATLPAGFRPVSNVHAYIGGNTQSRHAMAFIRTTGEIFIAYPDKAEAPTDYGFYGSVSFLTQ